MATSSRGGVLSAIDSLANDGLSNKEYAQFEALEQGYFVRSDRSDDDISDDEMEFGKAIVFYLD